ncbi:hypothetical protein FOB84_00180 [Gordonia bronchialis]|uniref:hypothetical protein n=1 Tax=Gordonia bronchialis TaxID=2054 RepID=UPI0011C0702D|nr:hypothetical protein [Gordonia bronchialis]MCC3322017.1 hypothetical protein [Gordonia bronchialis]QGS22844.1 hypothetical protein FOB84_00180 [Gordonia bronchialis]
MRVPDTRAAFRHFDLVRDPIDHQLDPALPEEPGYVHAVELHPEYKYRHRHLLALDDLKSPLFSSDRFEYTAICERSVRVILPMPVELDDPDLCPQCKHWLDLQIADPAEYRRQRLDWRNDRYAREEERRNVEEWNRRNGTW